jgi:hypothetical protein
VEYFYWVKIHQCFNLKIHRIKENTNGLFLILFDKIHSLSKKNFFKILKKNIKTKEPQLLLENKMLFVGSNEIGRSTIFKQIKHIFEDNPILKKRYLFTRVQFMEIYYM